MGQSRNRVLWNEDMSQCIGFVTDLSKSEFVEEMKQGYFKITGKELIIGNYTLVDLDTFWLFTYFQNYRDKLDEIKAQREQIKLGSN